ncbi:Golgin subfamily A member 7/ERF4 family-domain-containing protein [Calycina marina]|uniref:Ras modification protein ERF4 n=1 Tax=Calycina marina TaxID=1763456 RepID=A0A9P7ZAG2_9HELO|nr:Golgin subfamily A member 7/ERF4 family-domain-containing protein [Calycina marina]
MCSVDNLGLSNGESWLLLASCMKPDLHPFSTSPGTAPTASSNHLSTSAAGSTSIATAAILSANLRVASPRYQPPYPLPSRALPIPTPGEPEITVPSPRHWSLRNAFVGSATPDFASPFRRRVGTGSSTASRPRRTSAARLWNPTNSTPRTYPQNLPQLRGQRPCLTRGENNGTPIPLHHPAIGSPSEERGASGHYPLLTLPEQRQNRHSGSIRGSLQVERSGSSTGSNRIPLPRSIEIARTEDPLALSGTRPNKGKGKAVEFQDTARPITEEDRRINDYRNHAQSVGRPTAPVQGLSFEKVKEKAEMSTDLENGGPFQQYSPGGISSLPHNPNNASNASLQSGIGPAMFSRRTSIGSADEVDLGEEWGPQHPCFPHMNPHVPLSSSLYQTTRIIRIRRDWMPEGDLAPTFSNLYPEILDPAGVSEQEFRALVDRVNRELIPAFNPWGARNILDAILGVLTGWIWDDLGLTGVKARLSKVEQFLEEWNREMQMKSKDGAASVPQIVSLRRTGYMNLDIQVPDPEVSRLDDKSRSNTGLSQQITSLSATLSHFSYARLL